MIKNLIVSSADDKYSSLLEELYQSTLKLVNYDFAILDCGLKQSTLEKYKQRGIDIKIPKWEVSLPSYKIRNRNYLKAQFSRFYLHQYFPGYENYFWLDSDTWINCPETFQLYLQGVDEKGFAICPQVDRSSPKLLNIKWFLNFPTKINSINYKNISKSISKEMGKKYAGHFTLNAGCFGYSKNFDGLSVIQKNLKEASKKGRIFGSDQVALALSAFEDNLDFELLPSYCNWICEHRMPKFCESKRVFVEPYVPHHNIALIHLAGLDAERQNKNINHEIITLSGNKIKKSLRYEN
jgi:lipopolysaccharide biosynthesis glycosyltransferase